MANAVRVGEYEFDIDEYGQPGDPVVLLLHGFPETKASWETVASSVSDAGNHVIVPNQRGYSPGARPTAIDAYAIGHLVSDTLGILDAVGATTAHVVGHDWGSMVAWHTAARQPDRVSRLTTVSIPHPAAFGWAIREDADQRARSGYFELFRQEGKAEDVLLADDARRLRAMFGDAVDPQIVERHLPVVGERAGLTGGLNWYRAMTRDFDQLPAVTVPTTFVWSNADAAVGRACVDRCGDWVDAPYRFVEIDGVSHWIPEDRPQDLVREILAEL